jgi:hypothetical protein
LTSTDAAHDRRTIARALDSDDEVLHELVAALLVAHFHALTAITPRVSLEMEEAANEPASGIQAEGRTPRADALFTTAELKKRRATL